MHKIIYRFLFVFLLATSPLSYAVQCYGPTVEKEHLYPIALKVKPQSKLTVQQVMIALLTANPRAFVGNNINGLKAGYVLHIPSAAAIQRIHPIDAIKAVERQNAQWLGVSRKDHCLNLKPSAQHREGRHAVNEARATLAKTSVEKLATYHSERAGTQVNATQLPKPAVTMLKSSPVNDKSDLQLQNISDVERKLNNVITRTKKFETETVAQIADLMQQNKKLQVQVNQLTEEFRSITYRFIQLTAPNKPAKNYSGMLLESLRKNAVGLLISVLLLILLFCLLKRSLRGKPTTLVLDDNEEMSPASQLDLARSYIDMGDHASARSVLRAVIKKGNTEQQKEANDLLGKLNGAQ